eukprot:695262-Hanusia_phi.AAC.1
MLALRLSLRQPSLHHGGRRALPANIVRLFPPPPPPPSPLLHQHHHCSSRLFPSPLTRFLRSLQFDRAPKRGEPYSTKYVTEAGREG